MTAELLEQVDIVTTTSCEGLENLCALAEAAAGRLLRRLPLLVSSAAAAARAVAHGFEISPIISPHVNNQQILRELARWRNHRSRTPANKPTR